MANVKLTYINSTGGYVQPTANTDVVQNIGKIELTGVSSVALDANNAKITSVGTPSAGSDAANKDYVDSVAQGLSWKGAVRAVGTTSVTLNGAQTVDGVSLTDNDRVLITGQNGGTPDSANGIYVVSTSGAWSRASDAGAGELNAGTAVFVTEGTSYADTQWVLTTNNPITVGTTAIIFTQFGGGTTYSAGNGLALAGTVFSVDLATVSGLEFTGTELRIDVASADELSIDANGLNVEGVPSQFKINGSAVSTNVTHTNLNALTDSSTITALHRHSQLYAFTLDSSTNLSAGDPIYIDSAGEAAKAAANSASTAGVVGVAIAATSTNDPVTLVTHGSINVYSGLTLGEVYYLDDAGGIDIYSGIASGNRAIRIGHAINATTLVINIQDLGVKP